MSIQAVGAPYEEGTGAVYIYHGSKEGLRGHYAQRILGHSYQPNIETFGFSLASSDFDGNGYSDLMVGGFASDAIAYLPARPVVKLSSQLEFRPKDVNVETANCHMPRLPNATGETNVTCAEIEFCSSYNGKGVLDSLNFNVTIVLDVSADLTSTRRILFLLTNDTRSTQIISLKTGKKECHAVKFYVNPDVYDGLTAEIKANMTIQLSDEASDRFFSQLTPVMDADSIITSSNVLTISGKVPKPADLNSLPWWVYLLCVLGALLIIAVVTGILYKVNNVLSSYF